MVSISPPHERTCEHCGRADVWNDDRENWVVADDPGSPFCLHNWDINGTYNPIEE